MGLYLSPVGWIPPSLTPHISPILFSTSKKWKCNSSWKQQPATIVATIVMAIAGGFKEMKHESVALFDLGHTKYCVLVYGDDFKDPKVVSTLLCLWAFCSYVYGMYVKMNRDMVMKGANNEVHENDNIDDDDDKKQQNKSLIELNEIVTEDQR
nr:hypothetical protein [Tanacetum cinerariifolium]